MQAVAERIAAQHPAWVPVCAYLELSQPDLATAAAALVARQHLTEIRIVPLFLGVGRHVREDLPRLIEPLRRRYPQIDWQLRPAVGLEPRLIALLTTLAIE